MRSRDERSLELAARQVDAAREHLPEEAAEQLDVAAFGIVVVEHGVGVEEERDHAADALDDMWDVRVGRLSAKPVGEAASHRVEGAEGGILAKDQWRAKPRRLRQGFA